MRNNSLFVAMVVAFMALVSCSQDQILETPPVTGISFNVGVMDSRAMETTTGNLQKFDAIGFIVEGSKETPFYPDNEFISYHRQLSTKRFTSPEPCPKWPVDKPNVQFYAYAPSNEGVEDSPITPRFKITSDILTEKKIDFKCTTDLPKQVDFIVANNVGKYERDRENGVALTFRHLESQIIVKAKNTNPAYTCVISGVRIGRVKSKGTYNFGKGEWEGLNTLDTYTWELENPVTLDAEERSLMLPDNVIGGHSFTNYPMIIAQPITQWNRNTKGADGSKLYPGKGADNYGSYLAFKIKINAKAQDIINNEGEIVGTSITNPIELFPAGYSYDWAAIPIFKERDYYNNIIPITFEPGKRYTFVLDFTAGAGNVAPAVPTDPNQPDDPFIISPSDYPENKDAGEPILGPITLQVDVSPWDSPANNTEINMDPMHVFGHEFILADEGTFSDPITSLDEILLRFNNLGLGKLSINPTISPTATNGEDTYFIHCSPVEPNEDEDPTDATTMKLTFVDGDGNEVHNFTSGDWKLYFPPETFIYTDGEYPFTVRSYGFYGSFVVQKESDDTSSETK